MKEKSKKIDKIKGFYSNFSFIFYFSLVNLVKKLDIREGEVWVSEFCGWCGGYADEGVSSGHVDGFLGVLRAEGLGYWIDFSILLIGCGKEIIKK